MPGFEPPGYPPKKASNVQSADPADRVEQAGQQALEGTVAGRPRPVSPPPPGGGGGTTTPPPHSGGPGRPAPSRSTAPATTSANGKDPLVVAGFSQAYANQLYDLQNQWEIISGFAQPITTDALIAMAKQRVVGMGEFARYVWQNVIGGKPDLTGKPQLSGIQQNMPWLEFGYDAETFHSRLSQLASDWQRYTGEVLNPTDGALGQEWVERQLGGVTPGLAAPSIIDDPALQKAYGWVKYGLTFRDFQLKKEQMQDAFGSTLTNDQAVSQLHYFHAAQGAASQARAVQRPGGQQTPTGELATSVVR